MYTTLLPGAIGVKVSLEEGLELASKHGFAGYHVNIREAKQLGSAQVNALSEAKGVRLAAFGFPLEFRKDDTLFKEHLAELPQLVKTAAELGIARSSTWIMPFSNEHSYRQNFDFHVSRLKPAAEILAEHGIHLGLEYVGPKTLWSSGRFPFIHTMQEMAELCEAVGPNTGYLIDSFHWFTAQESAGDLLSLSNENIVEVHVNDAPDLPPDEQIDNQRELPGATGVIDIQTFLDTLRQLNYDGPVMVEPFSERVRQLSADEACAATAASFAKVGLG